MYQWRTNWFRRSIIETHPGYNLGKSRETLNDQTLWTSGCTGGNHECLGPSNERPEIYDKWGWVKTSKMIIWLILPGVYSHPAIQGANFDLGYPGCQFWFWSLGWSKRCLLHSIADRTLSCFTTNERSTEVNHEYHESSAFQSPKKVSHVSRLGFPKSPIQTGGFFAQWTTKTSRFWWSKKKP